MTRSSLTARILTMAPFGVVLIGAAYPLARFLLIPALPWLAPPQAAVPSRDTLAYLGSAVANTFRIGVETGLAVLLPAFLTAFLLERRTWRGGPLLAACLWMLFLTPSYLLTTGWQILMSLPGLRDGWPHRLFFSEAGIVGLLALKGLPFASLTARAGWSFVGGEIGAAARVHVRHPGRRALILTRLLAPVATAAFAIVFVEGISDFGVAATLGSKLHLPLVVYDIYGRLSRTPVDFAQSARLSLILIAMAASAVALHQVASRGAPALMRGKTRPAPRPATGPWESAGATILLMTLLLVAVGAPGAALLGRAGLADASAALSGAELWSLVYSTAYALVGSVIALVLGAALVSSSRGTAWVSQTLNGLTLGAMAVPGLVLGAAYVIAFNGWIPLYGTPLLLLAAYVVTHLPVLMRLLDAPLRGAHSELTDAARVHGLGWRARLEQIHLPHPTSAPPVGMGRCFRQHIFRTTPVRPASSRRQGACWRASARARRDSAIWSRSAARPGGRGRQPRYCSGCHTPAPALVGCGVGSAGPYFGRQRMSAPVISFSAVGKDFGATPVLRDIDLDVAPGEFLILVGGSGSGKTTLLRIAAGLEGVDRGIVTLRQTVVDQPALKAFRRRRAAPPGHGVPRLRPLAAYEQPGECSGGDGRTTRRAPSRRAGPARSGRRRRLGPEAARGAFRGSAAASGSGAGPCCSAGPAFARRTSFKSRRGRARADAQSDPHLGP